MEAQLGSLGLGYEDAPQDQVEHRHPDDASRVEADGAIATEGAQPLADVVERSAEPSVLVGFDDVRSDAGQTNLVGAYNCAAFARREDAFLVFLSTSRVYPWS